ncbi:MAG: hypothetical protein M3033_18575 [Acidobacteriota bacterium]|nr:hypothetical protein [Acidobacteriota bacterium]
MKFRRLAKRSHTSVAAPFRQPPKFETRFCRTTFDDKSKSVLQLLSK